MHDLVLITLLSFNLILSVLNFISNKQHSSKDVYKKTNSDVRKDVAELDELIESFYNKSDNGTAVNGLTYNLPHSTIKLNELESVEEVDEYNTNTILEIAD